MTTHRTSEAASRQHTCMFRAAAELLYDQFEVPWRAGFLCVYCGSKQACWIRIITFIALLEVAVKGVLWLDLVGLAMRVAAPIHTNFVTCYCTRHASCTGGERNGTHPPTHCSTGVCTRQWVGGVAAGETASYSSGQHTRSRHQMQQECSSTAGPTHDFAEHTHKPLSCGNTQMGVHVAVTRSRKQTLF